MGTGGVGKTSLSLCFAIEAAREKRKVAVITVDPSRRLNALLGLKQEMETKQQIVFKDPKISLDVYFVNTESTFEKFVAHHIDETVHKKIKENPIYRQISKNLRETHNFAALYKIVEILSTQSYDWIVLDTPPCHQVMEFFDSPIQLQKFFSHYKDHRLGAWVSWLREPFMEGILKKLAGEEFFRNMNHFFTSIGHLKQGIQNTSQSFLDALKAQNSLLVLVFSPAPDKVSEARFLHGEISKRGLKVGAYFLNRSWVQGLDQSKEPITDPYTKEEALYNSIIAQNKQSRTLLHKLKTELANSSPEFYLLPELEMKTKSQKDIVHFSETLRKSCQKI